MESVGELSAAEIAFLEPYLPCPDAAVKAGASAGTAVREADMPFVTLTYASSLDSMIALAVGARTTLSGTETKRMTHYLRLRHDAILIGSGTAQVDNPSLNCRYPGATLREQPRPVIVDPRLRWAFERENNLMKLASESRGKGPWVVTGPDAEPSAVLQSVGGEILRLKSAAGLPDAADGGVESGVHPLPWPDILRELKGRGINSVMIEGGARVINTLLSNPQLVDSVILTIAPTWLGHGGVAVQPPAKVGGDGERVNSAWLYDTLWRQFGNDVVLCGRPDSGTATD